MCDNVWMSPHSHSSLSVEPHFFWHVPQWLCPVWKQLSNDHWRPWKWTVGIGFCTDGRRCNVEQWVSMHNPIRSWQFILFWRNVLKQSKSKKEHHWKFYANIPQLCRVGAWRCCVACQHLYMCLAASTSSSTVRSLSAQFTHILWLLHRCSKLLG